MIMRKSDLDSLETKLKERYRFRFNVVKLRVEWKQVDSGSFSPLDDYKENSILNEMLKVPIDCNSNDLSKLLMSEFSVPFDPFQEYFDSLPAWDKEKDYIGELISTVRTTNNDLWAKILFKWIVGIVASCMDKDTVNQFMPILSSTDQGIGKSRWISKLIPKDLADYAFAGTINLGSKDSLIYLSECIFVILDEMANFTRRNDIQELKEVMTKSIINFRRAYGKYSNTAPRRASLIGSTNESQFLTDTTGSRRFASFQVISIDYNHSINMDNVYAQAYSMYKDGFEYWLNINDIAELQENNKSYEVTLMEEELLMKYFIPADIDSGEFLTATSIVQRIAKLEGLDARWISANMMGKILSKLKYRRVKNGVYGYYCIEKKGPMNDSAKPYMTKSM
jgi:predicted P-loop ATPase